MIDYREFLKPATDFVHHDCERFSAKHPDVEVATVGLCGDGFHGSISLHLDTAFNSDAKVKACRAEDKDYYCGTDEFGTYSKSCHDFAYYVGHFELPGYPDFYAEDARPATFVTVDGKQVTLTEDHCDEDFHEIMFSFLLALLKEHVTFTTLRVSLPFRVVAEIVEGNPSDSWTVRPS